MLGPPPEPVQLAHGSVPHIVVSFVLEEWENVEGARDADVSRADEE